MMCYGDRTWCSNETCRKYQTCDQTLRYAVEEQKKNVPWEDWLPVASRKFTKSSCGGYEKK